MHHPFERGERREHSRLVGGARVELEDRLGHESERALRADDQLGEVVACRALHEPTSRADDIAAREHDLETEHLVPRHAVLHGSHAARVRRHVAAE